MNTSKIWIDLIEKPGRCKVEMCVLDSAMRDEIASLWGEDGRPSTIRGNPCWRWGRVFKDSQEAESFLKKFGPDVTVHRSVKDEAEDFVTLTLRLPRDVYSIYRSVVNDIRARAGVSTDALAFEKMLMNYQSSCCHDFIPEALHRKHKVIPAGRKSP